MRDLYARLNLSPEASPQGIRSRLKNVRDSQLKRAAQEILLRPRRREVYDRNHRTLQLIGELREELDLTEAPNWKKAGSDDFVDPTGFSSSSSTESSTSTKDSKSSYSSTDSSAHTESSTSRSTGANTDFGTGEPYARENRQRTSSVTSAVGAAFGTFMEATEGKYGCILGLISRFVFMVMLFGSCTTVTLTCEAIQENSGPKTEETAESSVQNLDDTQSQSQSESSTQDSKDQSTKQESFSVPPKPLPGNGTWWKYTSEELIAPLRISVSEGHHYYVKVTEAFTDEPVLTVFIRSGQTIEVDVPTGNYDLKYAIGDTWYGRQHLFGPETEYLEANDTFNFEIIGQRVRGHRVELIVQEGGNLSTAPIPESEF